MMNVNLRNVNLRNHLFTRWSMMQPDRHTASWEEVVFCANLTGSKAPQSALSYLGVLTTQLLQESRPHYISDNHNSYQLHCQLSVFFLLSAAGHLASNGCFSHHDIPDVWVRILSGAGVGESHDIEALIAFLLHFIVLERIANRLFTYPTHFLRSRLLPLPCHEL